MEGKLTYLKTLNEKETERFFTAMQNTNELFIVVDKPRTKLDSGQITRNKIVSQDFKKVRMTLTCWLFLI